MIKLNVTDKYTRNHKIKSNKNIDLRDRFFQEKTPRVLQTEDIWDL